MPEHLSAGGSTLSARLCEPLTSTSQLIDLLLPPLRTLSLLPDPSPFSTLSSSAEAEIDPSRFVKRQLGLVQKVLVERVWPDWEAALQAEHGREALVLFERYFVPPPLVAPLEYAAEESLSAYAVLSTLLSPKSSSTLSSRSLEIVSYLLHTLSRTFNVEQVYLSTLCTPSGRATSAESGSDEEEADPASLARWEQTLKDLLNVPTRVANAWGAQQQRQAVPLGRAGQGVPSGLGVGRYFDTFTTSYLFLLWRLSDSTASASFPSALSSALIPLLSHPTFLSIALPLLIPRLLPPATFPAPASQLLQRKRHIDLWRSITAELSERELSRFLRALLVSMDQGVSTSASSSVLAARAQAFVLNAILGPLTPDVPELWKVVVQLLLARNMSWNAQVVSMAVVLWVGEDEKAKVELVQATLGVWGAKEELKASSDSRRLFLTALLLLSIASLPSQHPSILTLSRSPPFLNAVSSHLSLVAPLQRLLGMLVAEVVSARSVPPESELKPLSFGEEMWAGEGAEKVLCRRVREAVEEVSSGRAGKAEGWVEELRKVYGGSDLDTRTPPPARKVNSTPLRPTSVEEPSPAPPTKRPLISIISSDDSDSDSDDELLPYPLPAPPSRETLDILSSDDPALYHSAFPSPSSATSGIAGSASSTRKRGKLRAPVYVAELVEYLKGRDPEGGKEEADGEAERVEVGLREGEGLVRRKAGWGGELKENAVDLAFALMGLQDQFELDGFEQFKQNILVALLVACPREVAPAVIEQYFTTSYSTSQRQTLLASLAISARELAHLPIPPPPTHSPSLPPPPPPPAPSISLFPSKQLPPAMHRKLVPPPPSTPTPQGQLDALSADLTRLALSTTREEAEQTVPGAAREKLLSVRRSAPSRSRSHAAEMALAEKGTPTYSAMAAEVFILPLINRFWLYLRDYSTSPAASGGGGRGVYAGGAASAPILEPYLLTKFLATLSVLLHAARHSSAFLAVLVPETLGLVLALRTPSSAFVSPNNGGGGAEDLDDASLNGAEVLASTLELALVVLSASVDLDGGRTLLSSSVSGGGEVVSEVKEWAEEVFEREENRAGAGGEGGIGRTGRAAAGVLLRVEEVLSRWRGRVGW